ncbi:hypothetical protein Cus16_3001 [Curtobacterium sp. ER1/6]|nr:hypothetical protein Cus16_3001 [Curtobacterium sp. ER1/6]
MAGSEALAGRVLRRPVDQLVAADRLALPVDQAPAVLEGALDLDDPGVLQVALRPELVRGVLRDGARPRPDRGTVAERRGDADPGGDDVPHRLVVPGEELLPALGAGHPAGTVAGRPTVHGRDVQLHRGPVVLALQVARLDLPEPGQRLRLEPECGGEGCGGDLRPDHRGDEEPLDPPVGQGCRQRVGLPLPELGQPGAGHLGVEDAVHVGGGLAVADEQQSHGPTLRTPGDLAPEGGGRDPVTDGRHGARPQRASRPPLGDAVTPGCRAGRAPSPRRSRARSPCRRARHRRCSSPWPRRPRRPRRAAPRPGPPAMSGPSARCRGTRPVTRRARRS